MPASDQDWKTFVSFLHSELEAPCFMEKCTNAMFQCFRVCLPEIYMHCAHVLGRVDADGDVDLSKMEDCCRASCLRYALNVLYEESESETGEEYARIIVDMKHYAYAVSQGKRVCQREAQWMMDGLERIAQEYKESL